MSKQKDNIDFQIKAVELLDSEIHTPQIQLPQKIDFIFDISLEQRFSLEKDLIIVVCSIKTFRPDTPEQTLGFIKSSCIFEVKELGKFIKNKNEVKLSKDFITTINSVSISTTRGLMFSVFRGTFLHSAVLPLINPSQYKLNK